MTHAQFAAARGTIRYRGLRHLRLLAPALLLLATACLPTVHGGHFRPEASPGQRTDHYAPDCTAGLGPGKVIEIAGPSKASIRSRLEPASDRTRGIVGIYAPPGARVVLGDSGFVLSVVRSGRAEVRALAVDSVHLVTGEMPPWSYGGSVLWGRRDAPFARTIEGGERGRTMWIEFDAGPESPRPGNVELTLPALTIDSTRWSPGPITYRYRRLQPGILPFNC